MPRSIWARRRRSCTGRKPAARETWLEGVCQTLKHDPGGAESVLKQLRYQAKVRPWAKGDEDVQRAIT